MAGIVDISNLNTPPEKHEYEAAKYFADRGKNVTFLKPSSIPNVHTPDICMDGLEWEIKCPLGSGKHTIEHNIRKAVDQSHYIIIDLRRIKLPEKQCISEIEAFSKSKPGIKRIIIIKKNLETVEFPQKQSRNI